MSLWSGAVVGALVLVATDRAAFTRALPRVSALALWCVVAVGASGVVNAATRLFSLTNLVETSYGRLLLLKVLSLIVLVSIGLWHRRHVLPVLDRASRAAFLRVGALEALVMAA